MPCSAVLCYAVLWTLVKVSVIDSRFGWVTQRQAQGLPGSDKVRHKVWLGYTMAGTGFD